MRILIYSYNYHPEPIGIAPLMTDLAEGLVKRGHQVRVVTAVPWYPASQIYPQYRGKLYLAEERNGVAIQRCYVQISSQRDFYHRGLFEISFVSLSFLQALRGWRPQLILLTVPGLPVCVPAALLGWVYHCPIVLNLQDILPDAAVHVGLLRNKALIRVFKSLERFAYQKAAKISVIADGFSKNLYNKGVPTDKIVEIPNWVDINFIKPLPKNGRFRQEHRLEGKFVVLYSGNIALTQGLETVIEAAAELRLVKDIVFVIVGEEKALERLQKHCQRKKVDNVKLLSFQPRNQLPEMLAAADVALVMQKHNVIAFNMPSKIQVLLASGRAIIASVPAAGTAARAIEKSGGGLVVPPENPPALANAITTLYSDPQQMETLGKQGRQYALQNYSFELALDRYEELFAEVVEEKKQKRTGICY
ncbi:MAG: glycosyltransferase family 4 protein [Cyanophyceae cyanobacterium]